MYYYYMLWLRWFFVLPKILHICLSQYADHQAQSLKAVHLLITKPKAPIEDIYHVESLDDNLDDRGGNLFICLMFIHLPNQCVDNETFSLQPNMQIIKT
jgi:hypothetical protein